MRLRDAVLAVHDVAAGGGPVVPIDWRTVHQDAGWYSLRRPDGTTWHAWRAWLQSSGDMALWLVVAPVEARAALDAFVASNDLAATMETAWSAALARNTTALAAMRRWPDYRVTGFMRTADDDVVSVNNRAKRLIPSRQGIALPDPNTDPLPWLLDSEGNLVATQAEADCRIDQIHAPAFLQTIAGYRDHLDAPETT